MKTTVYVLLAAISLAVAVDESIFRKCSQSSFCNRCRSVNGTSRYEVLVDTLSVDTSSISVEIRNNENQHLFVLKLEALKVGDCAVNRITLHNRSLILGRYVSLRNR